MREALAELPGVKHVWRIEDGGLDELIAGGEGVSDETLNERRTARGGRRPGHDHLHLGHHRHAQGLPDHPRQPAVHRPQRGVGAAASRCSTARSRAALLFLPLAHSFARLIQVALIETGTVIAHTPNMKNVAPDLQSLKPTFLLGRAPRVREGLQRAPSRRPPPRARARSSTSPRTRPIAVQQGRETPAARGSACGSSTPLFDKLVYRKLRAATGGRLTAAVSGGSALGERLGHFFRGIGIEVFEG